MQSNDAAAVLDYFRQLAQAQERPTLDTVAQGLAQLFDADEIGLSGIQADAPNQVFPPAAACLKPYSWQTDADLLKRIRASIGALPHLDDSGVWLISGVDETQLAWVRRARQRAFSDTEQWTWMLASQTLIRWRAQSTPALLNRRLEEAAVVTGRLTHDFGNYLTGIMGFTELSLSQAPADGLLHRYLQEVLQASRRGASWIHRLHLFCRRGTPQPWPTFLSTILREEEARLRAAGVHELRWVTNLPPDLPLVDLDAGALQTVITELVNNASEASNGHGTITVTARALELSESDCHDLLGAPQPGKYVELVIADDGPGIAPCDRGRLFRELFFSTKPRHRGLGFLIVYGILQRFHAGFRLAEASGKGATMHLYFPVAALEVPARPEGEARHLLLVMTNPHLIESIPKILEAAGFRVSVATSPQMALSICAGPGAAFALVVIDLLLPQQPGVEVARRILDQDAKANFLFLHTQTSFHGLGEDDLLKRFALLRWPLQPPALLQAVQTALTQPKAKN